MASLTDPTASYSQAPCVTTPTHLAKTLPPPLPSPSTSTTTNTELDLTHSETVNATDIGIDSFPSRAADVSSNAAVLSANKRKRQASTCDETDGAAPVVPYLSKETLSLFYPDESHFLDGTNKSGVSSCGGVREGASLSAIGSSVASSIGTSYSSSNYTSQGGCVSPVSTATPLAPDPLLKTLLLKGGQQPNTIISTNDKFNNPTLDHSSSLVTTSTTTTNATVCTNNSPNAAAISNAINMYSPKLVTERNSNQESVSPEDGTISASFAFHSPGHSGLPSNFSVAGKDLTKSVILMDVAGKGSSTIFKLPHNMIKSDGKSLTTENDSFVVIEASGIVPQSAASASGSVQEQQVQQPQQHNMEILLQAIDMKETSPTSASKEVSVNQALPIVMGSPLPQLTVSMPSQATLNMIANRQNSPPRPTIVQKPLSTITSPMSPSITSPIFPIALQRPANPSTFCTTPTLIPSSMLSPVGGVLTSATPPGAINLPIYSLSPSNNNPLSTVTSHIISVPTTSSNALTSAAVFIASTPSSLAGVQSSSHMLALPTPTGPHTVVSSAEAIHRRVSQVFKDVDAAQRISCGGEPSTIAKTNVVTSPSFAQSVVTTMPDKAEKVTVNISGQELILHSNKTEAVGHHKDKRLILSEASPHIAAQSMPTNITLQTINVDSTQNGNRFEPHNSPSGTLQVMSQTVAGKSVMVPSNVTYQQLQIQQAIQPQLRVFQAMPQQRPTQLQQVHTPQQQQQQQQPQQQQQQHQHPKQKIQKQHQKQQRQQHLQLSPVIPQQQQQQQQSPLIQQVMQHQQSQASLVHQGQHHQNKQQMSPNSPRPTLPQSSSQSPHRKYVQLSPQQQQTSTYHLQQHHAATATGGPTTILVSSDTTMTAPYSLTNASSSPAISPTAPLSLVKESPTSLSSRLPLSQQGSISTGTPANTTNNTTADCSSTGSATSSPLGSRKHRAASHSEHPDP